jgi:cyclic pyranopterin phosphate synthase
MPEDHYAWLPRESILTFDELGRLARAFATAGATRVRLTGGEPLLRRDLATLVTLLRRDARLTDLSMTTNGVLLAQAADALRCAGLDRVTVSLDTLRPERLAAFAQSTRHAEVLAGIAAARRVGLDPVKVNTVVVRGFNDDELGDLIEFGRAEGVEIRFIEYMDVGGATRWSRDQVVTRRDILTALARRYGPIEPGELTAAPGALRAPAQRFRLPDGLTFGVIASVTTPFCHACDRSRVTADGTWLLCLYAEQGVDLRARLRGGATDDDIAALIADVWQGRADRGAEQRVALPERDVLHRISGLRLDPRREMHTRGG